MRLLNLGCGTTFHAAWVNVDLEPSAPEVLHADLRERLPYADGEFDAVYHAHVLEHFPADEAERFLRECLRVLRPGGILRVVVPDLEQIARLYLEKLTAAERGEADPDYRWMMLELFDQTVRNRRGGLMKRYLEAPDVENLEFIRTRIGAELEAVRNPVKRRPLWTALRQTPPRQLVALAREQVTRSVVRVVGGRSALAALDEGRFRRSGEVHQWMYDRYSLGRLLEQVGARDVQRCEATTSRIPDFAAYQLDSIGALPRKPDSMYLEGLAP